MHLHEQLITISWNYINSTIEYYIIQCVWIYSKTLKQGILTSSAISSIFVKIYSEVSYLNDKYHTENNKPQGTSSFFYCVEITGRGAVW